MGELDRGRTRESYQQEPVPWYWSSAHAQGSCQLRIAPGHWFCFHSDTQLASWWHFLSSAIELSRQLYLVFPALFFLTPPAPSSAPRPAWLSALLLCLLVAFSLSSHAPLLLFSPSSCDSSSCFLFVSHAPLLPHPHSLPPHSCTLPLMSRTCLYSLTQKPVSLPRLLLSAGE